MLGGQEFSVLWRKGLVVIVVRQKDASLDRIFRLLHQPRHIDDPKALRLVSKVSDHPVQDFDIIVVAFALTHARLLSCTQLYREY